jgi:hypothetical protein
MPKSMFCQPSGAPELACILVCITALACIEAGCRRCNTAHGGQELK